MGEIKTREAWLEMKGVRFKYLDEAKKDTVCLGRLKVEAGRTTILMGGSGCGKSTLAMLAAGIYPENGGVLSAGEIRLAGKAVGSLSAPERARHMAVVFQNPDLQFCMDTLRSEMIFCLENLSVPPERMDERLERTADSCGMTDLLDRRLDTLSGGEKQKAALCCALLLKPDGILLDEPFANLDTASAQDMIRLLCKWKESEGTTIAAIDHRLDLWMDLADEIVVLGEGGSVLAEGIRPDQLSAYRELFEQEGLFYPSCRTARLPKKRDGGQALVLEGVGIGNGKRQLLTGVSAVLPQGGMYALLGASGCGKTTLFSAILGQHAFDGEIRLFGKRLSAYRKKERFRVVSAVFQNPANQFVALNVLEEVKKSLSLNGVTKDRTEEEAMDLLDRYGLRKYRHYSPYMLSQGQQRRLAVLAVLAGRQKLLLLDEPTYGQDLRNTQAIMDQLRQLCREGLTVLFATHDTQTALRYSDGIFELQEGRMVTWNESIRQ